jgi:hypothetical protein
MVQVVHKQSALVAEPLHPIGVRRRQFLTVVGMILGVTAYTGPSSDAQDISPTTQEGAPLLAEDMLAIEQLNARYYHALDGLLGADSDVKWANTFTANGMFLTLDADGSVIYDATGTRALVEVYSTFPDVATTRHWTNNLLIEPDDSGARASSYIIAMDIAHSPSSIVRTGLYTDYLVRVGHEWRFQRRTLTLDPNSPSPS